MIIGKLKEALICLRAGRVTKRYPFEPSPPPEGFRGQPELDITRCTGCGACSMACPTRCIELSDEGEQRVMLYCLDRCSYCGQCELVCPEQAITMSAEYELATDTVADVRIRARFDLVRCQDCGEVVGTVREIAKLAAQLPAETGLAPEQLWWLRMCTACRRRQSLATAKRLHSPEQ